MRKLCLFVFGAVGAAMLPLMLVDLWPRTEPARSPVDHVFSVPADGVRLIHLESN